MMTIKEKLHRLVDEMPEKELHAAQRFLEYLLAVGSDPVLRAFEEAPWDDEPVDEETLTAIEESEQDLREGRVLSHEEVKRRLGHGTEVVE